MQDRYAGDVGDFQKFGLLRVLCAGSPTYPRLRLGVCWYLVANESHNADGKHVKYLLADTPLSRSLRACDPDLFGSLKAIVQEEKRNVSSLEDAGVLPAGALFYRGLLHPTMTPAQRQAWHGRALERLALADLVFMDPDNGLRVDGVAKSREKVAMGKEVASYVSRNQSVVVYHHGDRTHGGAAVQVHRRLSELRDATGVEPLGAVIAHRGSMRFFLVVPSGAHDAQLKDALSRYVEVWAPHVEFRHFDHANILV